MNIMDKNNLVKCTQENSSISFSIDRFEGYFAVCENRLTEEMILISKTLIPEGAKPGDILVIENNMLVIDVQKTKKEQVDIKNLAQKLFKRKS